MSITLTRHGLLKLCNVPILLHIDNNAREHDDLENPVQTAMFEASGPQSTPRRVT